MLCLKRKDRFSIWLEIRKSKCLEFVRFDSKIASSILFLIYAGNYFFLRFFNNKFRSLSVAGKIFRHVNFVWARRYVSDILKKNIDRYGAGNIGEKLLYISNIDESTILRLKQTIINDQKPFDKRLIILSPPKRDKKGVILVKFNQYFRYLSFIFDLDRFEKEYILILEPSGAGYFDEYILCLMGRDLIVVVQTSEPVDYQFIKDLNTNLIPIDIGANCWVNNRTFFPMNVIAKEYDIIMVSIWSSFKRHYHLFEALSKSKSKDKIKVALVGVPYPWSLDHIKKLAKYFGVYKCIEFFENISQQEVNILLNKSKSYVLLSKKEGFNKGIIEAMHANVPGFLLSGFNYGYGYSYINSQTGSFIHPKKLTEFIDNIDNILKESKFSPCEWVSRHMSAKLSTDKLKEFLSKIENEKNIAINTNLQIKINNPDCDYMDQAVWDEYSEHYKNLARYFRQN